MSKIKAHTRYRNQTGEIIPGVTTILENLGWNKQMLIAWSRREALAGNDPNLVKNKAADIGHVVHYLIECHLKNEKPDLSEHSPSDIDKGENGFLAYLDWEKGKDFKKIASELPLVSELFQYGGTLDLVANIDGTLCLVDFKSSNAIYSEHKLQIAAYGQLWNENNPDRQVRAYHILHLNKENGGFAHHHFTPESLVPCWEIFKALRQIHSLKGKV